jgi:hypothetical protein
VRVLKKVHWASPGNETPIRTKFDHIIDPSYHPNEFHHFYFLFLFLFLFYFYCAQPIAVVAMCTAAINIVEPRAF